ncbi:MAG: glycosyltransferase family 4 protein [Candidatus Bathyarchaeota archaeon]|nr:glycosyltransferase family 4 protein [Candidatus Bathyarchaeum sp.]
MDYDVVHVVNFPSIMPAIIATKLKRKLLIYDIEDTYIDQLTVLPQLLRFIGIHVEKLCITLANGVVLVDELQVDEFGGIPNPNLTVIYDSPSSIVENVSIAPKTHDNFVVFYAGYLSRNRNLNLDSMLNVIDSFDGVTVVFVGDGDLMDEIKTKARTMPNKVKYLGRVPYSEVLKLSSQADLLFSLRDPVPLVQKYICGSKFLEALMCAKPIIVNKGTSTAIKVVKHNCGLVVDAQNTDDVKNAVLRLKNQPSLCKELGFNGRTAYDALYGWDKMRQRLLNFYSTLYSDFYHNGGNLSKNLSVSN